MTKIKFGTDGWRAIIAEDYTVENVKRVAQATAQWIRNNSDNHSVLIGYDCRFGGELFANTTAQVMCANDIKVKLAKGFVSTPMISFGAKELGTKLGIIITASHNPPDYNGYKIKGEFGGPALPQTIDEVEALIPDEVSLPLEQVSLLKEKGMIEEVNLETMYVEHIQKSFDMEGIHNSGIRLAYDAMYGSGQNVMKRLFPDAEFLHCEHNPGFHGQAPEPIHRNLTEFSNFIKENGNIDFGLATDGDADRIGIYNKRGEFIDAHHIILLLIHYLYKYKNMSGKVVISFSASVKIKKMCEKYGLDYEITKIGFKHICERMIKEDVLVGGEESGGIAVKGHIPERDGIWDGLVLLEFMAKTRKSLDELIEEIYEVVGPFAYDRNDLHLDETLKQEVIQRCNDGEFKAFQNYRIENTETVDGFKYHFANDSAVMIRPSGTEPLLRVYAEAPTREEVDKILEAARETLLK